MIDTHTYCYRVSSQGMFAEEKLLRHHDYATMIIALYPFQASVWIAWKEVWLMHQISNHVRTKVWRCAEENNA